MISSTAQERGKIQTGSQESPDILNANNACFSMIGLSYDSHVGPLLLLIPSLSPADEWSKRFKIKGKKAVLPSDAEKSRLRRVGSSDVQFLLKNMLPRYVALQFFYVIRFEHKSIQKISWVFNRLFLCGLWLTKHNILWFNRGLTKPWCS